MFENLPFKIPKFPFWVWAFAGIVFLVGINVIIWLPSYTTSQPSFCRTCHYKEGFPQLWKESKVHPKITCNQCHAMGQEIVPTGFAAERERINPNCQRCHSDIMKKEITQFKSNVYNIKIPHQFHVDITGGSCTFCHSNVYHDRTIPETYRPRMEVCFDCHKREKTSCSKCHPKGSIEPPKQPTVLRSECVKCHKGFEDSDLKIYDLRFPHRRHLSRPITCETCHSNEKRHGEVIKTRSDCMSCHHREIKTECATCHQTQITFKKGQSLGEGKPELGIMSESVTCTQCHDKIAKGHNISDVKKSCTVCHETGYEKFVDEWQTSTGDRLRSMRAILSLVKSQLPFAPEKDKNRISKLIKETESLIAVVENDRSRGVHNLGYAEKIITQAKNKIMEARGLVVKRSQR